MFVRSGLTVHLLEWTYTCMSEILIHCMYFLPSGKDGKDDSSGDEDEDAETKKLRGQLNSEYHTYW